MRNTILMLVIITIVGCNFSKGVNKDLSTGLYSSWNGFLVDGVYLVNANGEKLSGNKVKYGSEISVVATGVENFQLKNQKAFPGLKMNITDKAGTSLLSIEDAYASLKEGASENDAKTLTATYKIGAPLELGKEYKLKSNFFDKENKKNFITTEVTIVVE